uniref:Uncharacterized protein n=1 Tax=Anopheles farauti TaxID=69004 RepID=A0A182Q9L0_9DIPT
MFDLCSPTSVVKRRATVAGSADIVGWKTAEVERSSSSSSSSNNSSRSNEKCRGGVRARRGNGGRSKCIFTVQDLSAGLDVEEGDVGEAGGGRVPPVVAVVNDGGLRRRRRRCRVVASGKRAAANQTMLKYLTHKLRTQSINDENHANEKTLHRTMDDVKPNTDSLPNWIHVLGSE